jgi:hypothetical protein
VSTLVYLALSVAAGAVIGGVRAGRLPYAGPACMLAAVIAAVTLSLPLGDVGPHLAEVAILPAAAGAGAGALLCRLVLARIVPRSQT